MSSLTGKPAPEDTVYFGEVSLTGAVRAVPQAAARLKEAGKLGFARAVIPEAGKNEAGEGLQINGVVALTALVAEIAARSPRAPRRAVGGAEET